MKSNWIVRCIGIAIAVTVGVFLLGYVTMQLWNWLIPTIFTGAVVINYWQAMGILVLSKILFGGFHGRGRHCGGHRGHWRSRWKQKWEGMSEEERAKFRSRCGDWCEPESKTEPQRES
jgi:hypothetical protein